MIFLAKKYKSEGKYVLALLGLCLLVVLPMLNSQFYPFHDEPNIAHLHQMIRALSEGQFPPRWIPDSTYNFGNPYYVYFYHLPFYVGSMVYFVFGASLIASIKTTFAISVFLAGIFFYLLMKRFFSPIVSLAASAVYIFTPYRAVDLYVRGAMGEVWGFVFMPLITLLLIRLADKQSVARVVLLSIGVAGLILSHNSSAFMFLPLSMLFAGVLLTISKSRLRLFKSMIASYLLALGLSAYYWVPVLLESKYIQKGAVFEVVDHFPFIKQLLYPSWGYGASVWGIQDGMSFQLGIVNSLLVVVAIISLVALWGKLSDLKRSLAGFSVVALLLALFMMNIRSLPLWNLIPFSSYIQFPWRFLLLTTFFSSVLVGFAIHFLDMRYKKFYIPILVIIFSIALTWTYFKPEKYVDVVDDFYLKRFFVNIDSGGRSDYLSSDFDLNSEDYLPFTIWMDEKPLELPEDKIEVVNGEVEYDELSSVHYKVQVESDEDTTVTLNSFYFPGWIAEVDGVATAVQPKKPYGNISVDVNAGNHILAFKFENTPVRKFSNRISLFFLVVLVVLLMVAMYNSKRKKAVVIR